MPTLTNNETEERHMEEFVVIPELIQHREQLFAYECHENRSALPPKIIEKHTLKFPLSGFAQADGNEKTRKAGCKYGGQIGRIVCVRTNVKGSEEAGIGL